MERTKMVTLRKMENKDRDAVMSIFNHYATTGFSAYPETAVPGQYFHVLTDGAYASWIIDSPDGLVGFGIVRPFLPFPVFSKTGMMTYFILPGHIHHGLGSLLLERLIWDAKKNGLNRIVVNVSSKNDASIRFHLKHGFVESGRLTGVGEKFGQPFDMIWMQKTL